MIIVDRHNFGLGRYFGCFVCGIRLWVGLSCKYEGISEKLRNMGVKLIVLSR